MKIFIANSSQQKVGGGWSWIRNFRTGMGDLITDDYTEADTYLIASPSMVQRDEVLKAKGDGKRIVLRIDNAVRNSRNRNTGMTRMKDFAEWADLIIFQSQWALDYLDPYLHKSHKSKVILNAVDQSIFHPPRVEHIDYKHQYLYSRFNRDETKNWEVARYWFSTDPKAAPDGSKLYIVGNFSEELREGNFDFYNNESYSYLGVLDEIAMANLYQNCRYFIYTYFNDACSNSLIEALCCGCKIVGDSYYRNTGGAPEILRAFRDKGMSYFSLERMCQEYKEALA